MSFDSGRLSHAYITDDHFAYNIAMAVVCGARDTVKPCKQCSHCDKASRSIHPDIIVIDEDKIKDIEKEAGKDKVNLIVSVNVVRWIKRDAYIVPNDSIQKAYIVKYADTMNVSAQNAFLKMLEEPPKHAVFYFARRILLYFYLQCVRVVLKSHRSVMKIQPRMLKKDLLIPMMTILNYWSLLMSS